MRDETFPILDPTHPEGPRRMIPLTDDELAAYHRHGELPPPSAFATAPDDLAATRPAPKSTLPAVPEWVQDPEKWVTLSRADRRALERHHQRQPGIGGRGDSTRNRGRDELNALRAQGWGKGGRGRGQ